MMSLSREPTYISPEEYLEGEELSQIRHEYVDGEVYAMSGASDRHETITGNIFALIKSLLRGSGCRVFVNGMKARIDNANVFYYPDVLVTCDKRDRQNSYFKKYPILIVEVLSPTTESVDRGIKFEHYRSLESLQEYVIVRQDLMSIECYRRNGDGRWELFPFRGGDTLSLTSINFDCPIEVLYEDVDFGAPGVVQEP